MTRKMIVTAVLAILPIMGLFAQGLEGVYQLELEGYSGEAISRGTGFSVRSPYSGSAYVMTSFHLLNARLLEAGGIKIRRNSGRDEYLKIAAYDELNDILLLAGDNIRTLPLNLSDDCSKTLSVTGYHRDNFMVVDAGVASATRVNGVNTISAYLSKGFSGAPVLNNNASVCGMVVLSSEMNANSVVVSASLLNELIKKYESGGRAFYTAREVRQQMGVERTVSTQEELNNAISGKSISGQMIINISPRDNNSNFTVKNAQNIIIEADNVSRLVVHRSRDVMVRGINAQRLIVNESENVTVTSCVFERGDKALFLKDSRNLIVNKNTFRNMNTGVVLMSASIDDTDIMQNNLFESVQAKIMILTGQN